jgi:hypothetical protein
VEGGIKPIGSQQSGITFVAPTGGYNDYCVFATQAAEGRWLGGFATNLFLTSRNGLVYSKLFLSISVNQEEADRIVFKLHGIANPNGSRNWEQDPLKTTIVSAKARKE